MFFVTFGLFRADQKAATEIDPTGRHGILISRKGAQETNDVTAAMRNFKSDIRLADPRIMDVVQEFPGEDTVGMITVFPSVVLQQQINSLTTRQIVPTGAGGFDFHWTHWCYAEAAGARTRHNLLMVQTLTDKQTDIVLSAVCHDLLVADAGALRLRERIVVFDSEMIPNSLIYPA